MKLWVMITFCLCILFIDPGDGPRPTIDQNNFIAIEGQALGDATKDELYSVLFPKPISLHHFSKPSSLVPTTPVDRWEGEGAGCLLVMSFTNVSPYACLPLNLH